MLSHLLSGHDLHPFSGMDVPSLLQMRAQTRREHAFIVWVPFDGPAQTLQLRRVPRPRRPPRRRPEAARRAARRCAADPPRQLPRGAAGLVRLRLDRRRRGDHQRACGWRRAGLLRRAQRRGGGDHAAALRRTGGQPLPAAALAGRDRHRQRRDAGQRARSPQPLRRHRRRAAAAPCARSAGAVQRAVHLGHHGASQGCAVDPRQRAVGRAHQRHARRPAARRRAPGAPAAVPHQCTGLLGAGLPVGRRDGGAAAALFGKPLLAGVAGARLHLDLAGAVLRQGADAARGAGAALAIGCGAVRSASRRPMRTFASRPSAGGA